MGDILLRHQELDRAIHCYQEAMKTHPAVAKTIYQHLEAAFEESLHRQNDSKNGTLPPNAKAPVLPASNRVQGNDLPDMSSLMPARHPSSEGVKPAQSGRRVRGNSY
ncbi:hypothetical protein IQ235_02770 [Oscillatoriales cyanobacterium LEGE 11467]|uniref:Uncharacterized protein n=2 Tax=Zarconia TaxID=2992130 RepID=A0A928VT04_9CYAN|nr:hypothetical protein [Zarconia navalis LEGE 11467]